MKLTSGKIFKCPAGYAVLLGYHVKPDFSPKTLFFAEAETITALRKGKIKRTCSADPVMFFQDVVRGHVESTSRILSKTKLNQLRETHLPKR